jgi:hypothetical protein
LEKEWHRGSALLLIEKLLPDPKDHNGTKNTEDEVGDVSLAEERDVEQVANECTSIAAHDAYNKVHATSLALAAHDAIGDVTNENACKDGPGGKICNMF